MVVCVWAVSRFLFGAGQLVVQREALKKLCVSLTSATATRLHDEYPF